MRLREALPHKTERETVMDTDQTPAESLLSEQVNSLTNQLAQANTEKRSAVVNAYSAMCKALVRALTIQVDNDEDFKSTAREIFTDVNDELCQTWKNPFNDKWTVEISYGSDVIGTVTGVEADDKDDAIEEVSSNIDFSNVTISVSLDYNGEGDCDSLEVEMYGRDFDLESALDLTYEATQE